MTSQSHRNCGIQETGVLVPKRTSAGARGLRFGSRRVTTDKEKKLSDFILRNLKRLFVTSATSVVCGLSEFLLYKSLECTPYFRHSGYTHPQLTV